MSHFGSIFGAVAHLNLRRAAEAATLMRWLNPQPGERVLDVGCGDGYYTSCIARAGSEVLGIDINQKRLKLARRFYRHKRSECRFMDAEETELSGQSFDKAVSFCVIEHFQRDERVILNIARVLQPAGLFVFSADSLSNPGITAAERERHQRRYSVNTFYTVPVIRDKLERNGFDLVEWRYVLTTPLSLALVRISWWLDRLPTLLAPLRGLGHLLLATMGRLISGWSERRSGCEDSGLMLLIKARKRAISGD